MTTNFPSSLDSLTNPTPSDDMSLVSHSSQHANVNDAVEALQAKVGVDSSAVTTSHDYKIAQLETAPPSHSHGDLYYTESEVDSLLAALNGSNITTGTVADARIASTITRDSEVSSSTWALYGFSSVRGTRNPYSYYTIWVTTAVPNAATLRNGDIWIDI